MRMKNSASLEVSASVKMRRQSPQTASACGVRSAPTKWPMSRFFRSSNRGRAASSRAASAAPILG